MTDVSDPVPGLGEYFRQFEAYRDNLNKIGFILTGSINQTVHALWYCWLQMPDRY
jgi:hypothetical protein